MRKSCDNCKYKDTHSKCGTCIEEYDAPLENWELSIVAIEQMMQERNLKLEHIMEYIEFEDECIEKGFTFNSLIESREKQIAKEPVTITIRNVKYPTCPMCGRVLWGKEYYCANCGQRVNRGD